MRSSKGQRPSLEEISVLSFTITRDDCQNFKRFDHYLVEKIPQLGRTALKALFKAGEITSQTPLALKCMPPVGTEIEINIPPLALDKIQGEKIPLNILYEDEHIIVVVKPAGLVTHPAPGSPKGTLANAVLYHCPALADTMGQERRLGIVHRLDKGTSGVLAMAKTPECYEGLILLFSQHRIERVYQALAVGRDIPLVGTLTSLIGRHPQNRRKMKANIQGGRQAITHYRRLGILKKDLVHLECTLETGRTHQIRVHLSELLRAPILCDATYGNPPQQLHRLGRDFHHLLANYPHPLLHAQVLGFTHPINGKKMRFEDRPSEIFAKTLELA